VQQAVREQLAVQMDAFFTLEEQNKLPKGETSDKRLMVGPTVKKLDFVEHRYDVEQSSSYKGLHTMYHLYTMEAEIDGLPSSDFTTIDFSHRHGLGCVNGWRWVSWQSLLDTLHARILQLERAAEEREHFDTLLIDRFDREVASLEEDVQTVEATQRVSIYETTGHSRASETSFGCAECENWNGGTKQGPGLDDIVLGDMQETPRDKRDVAERLRVFKEVLRQCRATSSSAAGSALRFPPSMLSKMAAYTITSEDYIERQSTWRRRGSSHCEEDMTMMEKSVTEIATMIQSFTRGMWMWVAAAAILALSMLVRLATDIMLIINGELGSALGGSAAMVSLTLSVLTLGLGLLLLVVLSLMLLQAPKIRAAISNALVKQKSPEVSSELATPSHGDSTRSIITSRQHEDADAKTVTL